MTEIDEKQRYSLRLQSQINAISEILSINTRGLIDSNREKELRKLKSQAEVLKRKIDTGEFEIAVIGLEKSGKSTFANAIMQNDILPSDNERCTYTSASIEYSSEGASAVVEIMTEDEFYEGFNEKIKAIGFKNRISLPDITAKEYSDEIEKLEAELKKDNRKLNKNLNEDILNIIQNKDSLLNLCRGPKKLEYFGEQLDTEEFKNLICSPDQAVAVKRITIKTNQFKGMQNAVLYDVPGFDSPTTLHKKQTKEFMNKADAIVLVSRANEPSFKETETNLFDDYKNETDDDETILADKMFPFANKVDIIEPNKGRTWEQQFERNVEVLQSELKKYCNFTRVDRIVVGSALAHLKQEPVKQGVSDGIDEIKHKLEDYYNNERFNILKRRVTSYDKRIKEVFETLKEENSDDITGDNFDDFTKIVQELQRKNSEIKDKLEEYSGTGLKKRYNSTQEISKEVEAKIVSDITKENFAVTDDELDWAKYVDDETISDVSEPEKIETYLRKKKFNEIYGKFYTGIIKLAEQHHLDSDIAIRKIFTNSLIGEGQEGTTEAQQVLDEYIKKQKDVSDGLGYYQSLVERFARDLFEILINNNYGYPSRWNKYAGERDFFDSVSMFDKRKVESVVAGKQPLVYSLLFHDVQKFEKYDVIKDVLDNIKTVLEFVPTPKIVDLVTKLVFSNKTAEQIKKLYSMVQKTVSNKESVLEGKLKMPQQNGSNTQKGGEKEEKSVPEEISENSYNDYFSGQLNKNDECIKNDIAKDIEILHDVVENVVVRAIHIEKPFLTLQKRNIAKLINSLNSQDWEDFVRKNAPIFRASQCSKLKQIEQRRSERRSILERIDSILKEMNNSSTTNTEN